jgi:hypothetical protein
LAVVIGLAIMATNVTIADPPLDQTAVNSNDEDPKPTRNWNLPWKTLGGAQLWTDHLNRGGDRLQQNVLTGHWRVLDDNNIRRGWGTRAQCESILNERHPQSELDAETDHVVVLLHGLMRTSKCMQPLEQKLAEEGFPNSIRFSYASTRSSIGDQAAALRETLEDYPAGTTFSFVSHSMGNIVVRHLIGQLQRDGDPKGILPRCKAMVMLGPPNQGAAISRRLAATGVYELVTGKGGMELGPEWQSFVENLATPPFPFAIIAGDVSHELIHNPLVDGASDFVVSVEEADLAGRQWLKTVPVLHTFLVNDLVTMSMTVDFLREHQ